MVAGRPLKLTPTVVTKICDAVEAGANYADAAAVAGVSDSALSKWRMRGAELEALLQEDAPTLTANDQKILDFYRRLRAAESRGAVNAATVVYNAALTDPEFALKWLERRRPADWSLRQQMDVTSGGQPLKAYVVISPDDWEQDG